MTLFSFHDPRFLLYRKDPKLLMLFSNLSLESKLFFHLEMDELGSGTEMDENTGCTGPGDDTKKVCFLYFMVLKFLVLVLFYTKIFYNFKIIRN